jgi:hypothetical protein
MATSSEVKTGLDSIASVISEARSVVLKAQTNTDVAVASLNALPGQYSDVIATINAYGTVDAFEALAKAELAKLTAEFIALVNAGGAISAVEV